MRRSEATRTLPVGNSGGNFIDSIQSTCSEGSGRQFCRDELLQVIAECRLAAALVQQLRRCGPAHAHEHRIAADPANRARINAKELVERTVIKRAYRAIRARDRLVRRMGSQYLHAKRRTILYRWIRIVRLLPRSQIDDRLDADAMRIQGEACLVRLKICRNDHDTASRRNAMTRHQGKRRSRQHHARQIIVAENGGLLDDARGKHHGLSAHLGQSHLVHEGHPVIGVASGRLGLQPHADPGGPVHLVEHFLQRAMADGTSAAAHSFIHQRDTCACARGGQGRRDAARPCTKDQYVTEPVALWGCLAFRIQRYRTEAGQAAEHPLPAREVAL